MKQSEQELGLPEAQKGAANLREQVASFEDTLKRIKPMVQGTTKESFVTQSQQERMINAAQQPIIENLGTAQTNLARQNENISALQDRQARLVSGFTADKQTNLNIALQKIQRGEQLTDIEASRAYEDLQSEKNYNRQVEMAKLQQQLDVKTSNATKSAPVDLSKYFDTKPTNGGNQTQYREYPAGSGIYRTQGEITALQGGSVVGNAVNSKPQTVNTGNSFSKTVGNILGSLAGNIFRRA